MSGNGPAADRVVTLCQLADGVRSTRLLPHWNGKGERAAPVQGRHEYAGKVTARRGTAETVAGLRNLDRFMTTLELLGADSSCRPASRPWFARPHFMPG